MPIGRCRLVDIRHMQCRGGIHAPFDYERVSVWLGTGRWLGRIPSPRLLSSGSNSPRAISAPIRSEKRCINKFEDLREAGAMLLRTTALVQTNVFRAGVRPCMSVLSKGVDRVGHRRAQAGRLSPQGPSRLTRCKPERAGIVNIDRHWRAGDLSSMLAARSSEPVSRQPRCYRATPADRSRIMTGLVAPSAVECPPPSCGG